MILMKYIFGCNGWDEGGIICLKGCKVNSGLEGKYRNKDISKNTVMEIML